MVVGDLEELDSSEIVIKEVDMMKKSPQSHCNFVVNFHSTEKPASVWSEDLPEGPKSQLQPASDLDAVLGERGQHRGHSGRTTQDSPQILRDHIE